MATGGGVEEGRSTPISWLPLTPPHTRRLEDWLRHPGEFQAEGRWHQEQGKGVDGMEVHQSRLSRETQDGGALYNCFLKLY